MSEKLIFLIAKFFFLAVLHFPLPGKNITATIKSINSKMIKLLYLDKISQKNNFLLKFLGYFYNFT